MVPSKRRKESPPEEEPNDPAQNKIPILLPQDERHRTVKVAVALAIIRTKPDNVSAEDYVIELAEQLRSNEAKMSDVCQCLEDDVLQLQQKVALMSIRSSLPSNPFAYCREPTYEPTEKLSITAERIAQHWAFLQNYLSVTSNAALLKRAVKGTDAEELTLRSANNLLRTLRKSAPISGTEMELCHKALSTLSDMCNDRRNTLTPSLQAAVVDFIADCLNEIAERREERVDYRRQENIASWVGSLARGQVFTLPIVRHLLDKLLQFDSFIDTLQEDQKALEIDHFDRSFCLLQCTQNAVASLKEVSPLVRCELSDVGKALVAFCNKCRHTHPLFARYLYDILKVLKDRITPRKSNKPPARKLYTYLTRNVH